MEPAKRIINLLGGEANVARITGTAYTAPYRWQHAREKGGTDGRIPQKHFAALLAYARETNKPLTADDFMGASQGEAA